MEILIPVSPGELLDKLTILDIKLERIGDADQLANVRREHELLSHVRESFSLDSDEIDALRDQLLEINKTLWDVEDDIRELERLKDFGERFVGLARSVYLRNDERAAIKKRINQALGSQIVEEKSYRKYR